MLAVEGVRLSFGGAYALDRVDLTVSQGESVGLIGPNGSGKSSLFNVVTGIYEAGSGRVRVAGHDVTRLAPHRIVALGVARTVQTTRPFERLSVVDNVRAVRGATRKEAEALIENVGLASRREAMAATLSFSERRRLDLARALALKPRLLLLDEPAGALTAGESAEMAELLSRVALPGRTVIIVEHKLDLIAALCPRVVVMHLGRVIADGSPEAIRRDPAVRAVYFAGGEAAASA